VGRRSHAPASELAEALLDPVAAALGLGGGERVLVLVNGLGATHGLELHVMFAEAARLLDRRGIVVERVLVGPYVTSLDMSGCSLTVVRLDDELTELWDAPVRTPALTW
jgi:dihydroxyacetone kinase-like protein